MPASPVKHFVLKVILWLPLCFAVWYYMKGVIGVPTFFLVDGIMSHWLPGFIKDIEFQGHLLNVVLQFALSPPRRSRCPRDRRPNWCSASIPSYTATAFPCTRR